VNGQIFINIGAFITGAQGVSLRFTGYECVKWVQPTELRRPRNNGPGKKGARRRQHDPIAAIPKGQLFHSKTNVIIILFRLYKFLIVNLKMIELMIIDQNISRLLKENILECNIFKQEICSQKTRQ
jgi:hypothetical protein